MATPGASADGYTTCRHGHQHWGKAGAAGLLVRTTDRGGVTRYLLQHRSPQVHHGDTWGVPGGALHWAEPVADGALREAVEELGPLPTDLELLWTHTDDHGGWAYSTVVLSSPTAFPVAPTGWETGSGGAGWFTAAQVAALPLHPGFALTWPLLLGPAPG